MSTPPTPDEDGEFDESDDARAARTMLIMLGLVLLCVGCNVTLSCAVTHPTSPPRVTNK